MYIKDGIRYAGELVEGIKVKSAHVTDREMMMVTFSTGEVRIFDATQLKGSAFKPLKDKAVFEAFSIRHGVLTWCNETIDIAPEALYELSLPYTTKEAAAAFHMA